MLVGRGPEQAAIDEALAAAAAGRSSALAFTGAPGIGKTALLAYAQERGGEMTVLRARGIESEARIPFASLLELLRPVLGLLGQLAGPQAAALEEAFALRPGRTQDRFAVGAATLGLVAACADTRPVLLLLDDAQWFDEPSAEALRFMLRRLVADPVAAIVAVREGHRSLLDGAEIRTLMLDGLSASEVRILRDDIAGAAADQLAATTGGNPLALLELSADADELALAPPGAPLVLSARVSAAYLRRATALGEGARRCLLLAATSDSGDMAMLARAAGRIELDIGELLAAESAGLVRISAGSVEFQHPLVRSAVYTDATLGARREAHRALAAVLPDHELDRRAWHLAAAAVGADGVAADALGRAGRRSLERGGYASATAAFERAARLTDAPARRKALLLQAAEAAWEAGRPEQSRRLLDESRAAGTPNDAGVFAAEHLAGRIATSHGPVHEGHAILVAAAGRAAADPARTDEAITLLADATIAGFIACEASGLEVISAQVQSLLPGAVSAATLMLGATIMGVAQTMSGDAAHGARSLRRAVAICEREQELLAQPSLLPWIGLSPLFLRESQTGREQLETALRSARARGAIGSLPFVLVLIGRDQATTEQWRLAQATYREAVALARETDQRTWLAFGLSALAWLQARLGNEQECRRHAAEALELSATLGARLPSLWALIALGELELAQGRPAAALDWFEQQRRLAAEGTISDVDLWPAAEIVEACVRLGADDRARTVADGFRSAAAAKGQPWSMARALRCEGLTAPADAFAAAFEQALALHEQTPDVFELARTRLAYGERLRRSRSRVLARVQLRAAEQIFATLDARPWAEVARAELEATGEKLRRGEPRTTEELTPQELQIAMMLASGRTTRETAAALFLSPKTIEYHLRHVYLKLEIHSREELARILRT